MTLHSAEGKSETNRPHLKVQKSSPCIMSYPKKHSSPIVTNKFVNTPPQMFSSSKRNINWKSPTEKSSLILVSIVLLFIITHSYRIALKMYEVLMPQKNTMENFRRCMSVGRLVQQF